MAYPIPTISTPFLNPDGAVSQAWYLYLQTLGGLGGDNTTASDALLDAELIDAATFDATPVKVQADTLERLAYLDDVIGPSHDEVDSIERLAFLQPEPEPVRQVPGGLEFQGIGNRILGDFSNATVKNRVSFQTLTTNGITTVQALPNGSGAGAYLVACSSNDPTNATVGFIGADSSAVYITAGHYGSGSNVPMLFQNAGSTMMTLSTTGNLGIGLTPGGSFQLEVSGAAEIHGNLTTLGNLAASGTVIGQSSMSALGAITSYNTAIGTASKATYIYNDGSTGQLSSGTGQPLYVGANNGTWGFHIDTGGVMNIGTVTATPLTPTGYITLKDSGGSSIRVLVG